jgi:hypothetical protein
MSRKRMCDEERSDSGGGWEVWMERSGKISMDMGANMKIEGEVEPKEESKTERKGKERKTEAR